MIKYYALQVSWIIMSPRLKRQFIPVYDYNIIMIGPDYPPSRYICKAYTCLYKSMPDFQANHPLLEVFRDVDPPKLQQLNLWPR